MKKIYFFCLVAFLGYSSFLVSSHSGLFLDMSFLDQGRQSGVGESSPECRQKSREFSKFMDELSYFQMRYTNEKNAAEFDHGDGAKKIKQDFQGFVGNVFIWQDANREFILKNLLLVDEHTGEECIGKTNPYNDTMLPLIQELSCKLGVILPLLFKVIESRPSSPSVVLEEQQLYSFPGSPVEKEQSIGSLIQNSVSSAYVGGCFGVAVSDTEPMSARLRRTPNMPKSRSSLGLE